MSFFSPPLRAARLALLVTLALLGSGAVRADEARPFLHPLFTDDMVLQRGIPDPVWGWTTPGAAVTVRVAGKGVRKGAKAIAGADGKWLAKLPPLPVGGPYTLTVSGPQTVMLHNVLVGDVWLCCGQSNMSFGISGALNAKAEIAAANYPNIRLFTVTDTMANEPRRLPTVQGPWGACTPQLVATGGWGNGGFSAVAYFFGRDLQQAVHVPIGLIHNSWPGTTIEAWTSAEATGTMPVLRPALAAFQKTALAEKDGQTFDRIMEAWYAKHDPPPTPGKTLADPDLDTSAWKTISQPTPKTRADIPTAEDQVVWFRRDFVLPAAWIGKDLMLHLGPVNDEDTTYVNGTRVGGLYRPWQGRDYSVLAALLRPGRNVLAVRVLNLYNDLGMPGKPEDLHLEPAGDAAATPLPLAGPWRYQTAAPVVVNDPPLAAIDGDINQVTCLYNGMVAPLVPFGLKGVLWYQGEFNAWNAKLYQTQLPTMIGDWRGRWGEGDFPFLIVQLANIGPPPDQPGKSSWAELREAQLLTAERVPKTGLALAVDVGEANDIHPHNKQEVGRRLALTAEATVYGQKVEYSGPIYGGMTVEGGAIRLRFRHLGGGLVAKGGDKLTGFAIAGADGKFVWADAKIDGPTVVVSSPDVPTPTAVRYAWADNPVCNLYNQAGLPASPFRTDTDAK